MPEKLRIYLRHGCHLCDDMQWALESLKVSRSFTLELIDISGDAVLEEQYGTRVPVLIGERQGAAEEICYYFLDQEALHAYFSRG